MKLIDAIANIQYDRNWGIWALDPLSAESEAHYGQHTFENGDVPEQYVYVCNGETAGDLLSEWRDDNGELIDGWFDAILEFLDDDWEPYDASLDWGF